MKQRAPMRKKSNPRSSSSKLSPRSARNADIEMGRRIRLRRRETGISQMELAGRLGLSFQQVQKYEKGTSRVGAARLQQIAKILGVSMPFFYDGDGKEPDVDSVLVLNSVFSLRLLRAYTGSLSTVFKHHFARQAAAALLKFAKATSDPQVAAALVEKAADLKDRLDGLPPPLSDVLDSHETPTQNNDPR